MYYHSGHRTLRVFRISDGTRIANFKAHAEVTYMAGTMNGETLVVGAVDGSLTILTIADPEYDENVEFLQSLPSRKLARNANGMPGEGEVVTGKNSMGTALQVARFVAKARAVQRSRACVIS